MVNILYQKIHCWVLLAVDFLPLLKIRYTNFLCERPRRWRGSPAFLV